MIFKIIATILTATIFAGFALVFGGAGSYALDSIDFKTVLTLCGIGFSLIAGGIGVLKVITQAYFKE